MKLNDAIVYLMFILFIMLFFMFGYLPYSYFTGIPKYKAKQLITPKNFWRAYWILGFREDNDCVMDEIFRKLDVK